MKHSMILRAAALTLALILCIGLLAGCGKKEPDSGKKTVVVTIYPVYDWVKNLLGDRADQVELVLLEDSGADLHNYQPTVEDIYTISKCDLFVYVGGESDGWVPDALSQASNKDLQAVNLMEALGDAARVEELPEGAAEEEEEEEEDEIEYDEHIWLSPKNALLLCRPLTEALIRMDGAHKADYEAACADYEAALRQLDADYTAVLEAAPRKVLLFADRYPFLYLVKDYGLTAYAAFSGCSAETEASFEMIHGLAARVDSLELPYILVLEGSDCRIADTIISESRAGNAEILSLDSMQGTTRAHLESGVSYLDVMRGNLDVLQKALS